MAGCIFRVHPVFTVSETGGTGMIIRKLQDNVDMTDIEKGIADYILNNSEAVVNMTAKELAQATYTSPSSVLRLCSKVDEKGFADFKMRLAAEINDMRKEKLDVNTNQPFGKEDSIEEIARKIEDLSIVSIKETRENLNYVNLKRIAARMNESRVIDIYGMGGSQTIAMDFKDRMIRIGRDVRLESEEANRYYQAMNSDKTHFAIVISHSGMTKNMIEVARILKEQKTPILGITSEGENDLIPLVNYSIRTATAEQKFMMYKIENMASQVAVKYILDVLFACIYDMEYEEHFEITKRNEMRLKKMKYR